MEIKEDDQSTPNQIKQTRIEFYSELVNDDLYKRVLRLRIGFENWGPTFSPVANKSIIAEKERDYWKYNSGMEEDTIFNFVKESSFKEEDSKYLYNTILVFDPKDYIKDNIFGFNLVLESAFEQNLKIVEGHNMIRKVNTKFKDELYWKDSKITTVKEILKSSDGEKNPIRMFYITSDDDSD